jgi:MSHA pilin protein MshC
MTRPLPAGIAGRSAFRGQSGFTMVELVVVIVLVGILAAVGVARFFDRSAFDTHAYAEQVRAMLRYAQKSAIARNTPVYVRFEENRISLCHAIPASGCGAAWLVANPGGLGGGDEATRNQCGSANWYCIGRPPGITWTASPSPDWLMFDALGRPLLPGGSPGGLALAISGGRDAVTVSVTQETGYVQ